MCKHAASTHAHTHAHAQGAASEQMAAYADVASALLRLRLCAGALHSAWMTLGKPSLAQVWRGRGKGGRGFCTARG